MVRFPRTARARATSVTVAGVLVCAGALTPLAHADPLQDEKHQVERRIAGAHDDLDESSARLRHAAHALLAAQARLGSARARLADTRGRLAAARTLDAQMAARLALARDRLARARADVVAGRLRIADQQDTLRRIVVATYQTGDPSLMGLSMVLSTQDPTDLTGRLNSVQNVMDKESVVLDRLEATRVLLVVQEQEVARAAAEVADRRRQAAANLAVRRSLEAQAQTAEASVARLVAVRATTRRAAATARTADLAQLGRLRSEQARIAGVLRARAAAARARAAAGASTPGAGPVHSTGFLDYPVSGPVTSPFGWRIHPIYGYRSLHDGTDFGAACGTPIRAAASGTVVESYFQTAWGNRVIIDHGFHRGVGLATITNHMNAPAIVSPGQHVERGQVVGYVGTTGWSTGCHLHFTVMQDGVPVDPMSWF